MNASLLTPAAANPLLIFGCEAKNASKMVLLVKVVARIYRLSVTRASVISNEFTTIEPLIPAAAIFPVGKANVAEVIVPIPSKTNGTTLLMSSGTHLSKFSKSPKRVPGTRASGKIFRKKFNDMIIPLLPEI